MGAVPAVRVGEQRGEEAHGRRASFLDPLGDPGAEKAFGAECEHPEQGGEGDRGPYVRPQAEEGEEFDDAQEVGADDAAGNAADSAEDDDGQAPQLDLVPASRALTGAQVELVELPGREHRLRTALSQVRADYDVVLIDCPPSLGILTLNALVAADLLLAPVQCEYLALEGVAQLMETIDLVRATLNPRLELLGMLMTMYDPRTRLSTQVVDEVRRHFPQHTFDTVIPRSVRLSEAPSYGKPVLEYEPTSRGAGAYADLAQELIRRGLLR